MSDDKLTKREYVAAQLLAAMLTRFEHAGLDGAEGAISPREKVLIGSAIKFADELIRQLEGV